jgi:hypothetical protein
MCCAVRELASEDVEGAVVGEATVRALMMVAAAIRVRGDASQPLGPRPRSGASAPP